MINAKNTLTLTIRIVCLVIAAMYAHALVDFFLRYAIYMLKRNIPLPKLPMRLAVSRKEWRF